MDTPPANPRTSQQIFWDLLFKRNESNHSCWCAHGFGKGSPAYQRIHEIIKSERKKILLYAFT